MRWSPVFGAVGLLVAGLFGSAFADGWRSPSYHPYPQGYVSPAPGCATPLAPPSMAPAPGAPTAPTRPTTPTAPGAPGAPAAPTPEVPSVSPGEIGAGGGEAGGGALAGAPNMIGDLGVRGYALVRTTTNGGSPVFRRVPLAAAGSFKIAENESPRPQNRVFVNYNYFNGVNTLDGPSFDLHRATFGFERTFLDGDASLGVRMPVLQDNRSIGAVGFDGFGDLSIVLKYAAINDCNTGNVLSGGLVVTVPTGRDIVLADGNDIHNVLLQPWVGYIAGMDALYTQGFASVVIPIESQDVTFLSLDFGAGYRLFQPQACDCQDRTLTALIPTIEGHMVIPLNHRGSLNTPVGLADQFVMTAGVHMGLWSRAWFTVAGALPLTGPQPQDFEIIAQFNFKF